MSGHLADDTVRAIIGQIRRTDWRSIEAALIAALRRDRSGSPIADGFPAGASGAANGRSASDTTTTEAAVFARAMPSKDEHHHLTTDAVAALHTAARACVAMTNALRRIDEITTRPPATYRAPSCAEPYCEDAADPSRKGRCEPCYRWRDRKAKELGVAWSEVGIVPRATIEERKARRAARRVHVNGPLAGR